MSAILVKQHSITLTLYRVFSCEFSETIQNSSLTEDLWTAASVKNTSWKPIVIFVLIIIDACFYDAIRKS